MRSPSLSHHEAVAAAFSYPRTGKRGVPQQFPRRLYEMLEMESTHATTVDATGTGYEIPLIAWSDTGRAFRIADVQLFAALILPKYFRTSKFSSFQRNLNLYGFAKIRRGPETDMYAHPEFVRGQVDSLVMLRKLKTAERKSAKTAAPKTLSSAHQSSSVSLSSASSSSSTLQQPPPPPQEHAVKPQQHRGNDALLHSPRIVSPSLPKALLRQSSCSSTSSSLTASSSFAPPEQTTNASGSDAARQQLMHGISIPSLLQQYQRQRSEEASRTAHGSVQHMAMHQHQHHATAPTSAAVPLPPPPQYYQHAASNTTSMPMPPLPTTTSEYEYGLPPLALPAAAMLPTHQLPVPPPPQQQQQLRQYASVLPPAPAGAATTTPAEPARPADSENGGKLALLALAMTSMAERP